jgi:TrwC relaxase
MCEGIDGRWGALGARLIYAHAKAAGYLYKSHLRHRLSTGLGVDWTEVENGMADVAGVPEAMIEQSSKRAKEIRGRLDEVTDRVNAERERLGLASRGGLGGGDGHRGQTDEGGGEALAWRSAGWPRSPAALIHGSASSPRTSITGSADTTRRWS